MNDIKGGKAALVHISTPELLGTAVESYATASPVGKAQIQGSSIQTIVVTSGPAAPMPSSKPYPPPTQFANKIPNSASAFSEPRCATASPERRTHYGRLMTSIVRRSCGWKIGSIALYPRCLPDPCRRSSADNAFCGVKTPVSVDDTASPSGIPLYLVAGKIDTQ
uniref:Uncharacterized protein n=1 Tax=Lygus hesperus TaxID=30085 RepID=A0A0A9WMP8_LYGHE